jgi:integrase/recombinase XerD
MWEAWAVAKLHWGDFQHDGLQYVLRFQETSGKSREISVRHDLEGIILDYADVAGIAGEAKESPLFWASNGRSRKLAGKGPSTSERTHHGYSCSITDARIPA